MAKWTAVSTSPGIPASISAAACWSQPTIPAARTCRPVSPSLPIYTTFGGDVGIGQRFNRLDLSIKRDVERTIYQDSKLIDGTTASNEDRQYNQFTEKARAAYEVFPGVKPFVEVDADTRVHDLNTDLYGYQRNSRGLTGLLGSTFDLRGTLTGEVAVGYTQRKYEDPRLDKLSGLIGNASLIWTANALTTVKLTATSSIGESTIPGVSGVLSRDIGLQIDHSFRRWLIGTVKLGFGIDSYKGATVDPADWLILRLRGVDGRRHVRGPHRQALFGRRGT